ncbi:hypothetical protein CSB09_04310 [Candidatus Gracilibacteria bacterium]|nr:MAG: hypothetical protein CSB09_04310 [Candidatus Gracilibacteria bacterium]
MSPKVNEITLADTTFEIGLHRSSGLETKEKYAREITGHILDEIHPFVQQATMRIHLKKGPKSMYHVFNEVVSNSLDANANAIRVAVKHNTKLNSILFLIADNGDGVHAKDTNQKKKHTQDLGGKGLGMKIAKFYTGGNAKLLRSGSGAIVSARFYLNNFLYNIGRYNFDKMREYGELTEKEQKRQEKLLSLREAVFQGNIDLDELPNSLCKIFGSKVASQYLCGDLTEEELIEMIDAESVNLRWYLEKIAGSEYF